MEPFTVGALYVLVCLAICAIGLPVVLLAKAIWGDDEGRDEVIWVVIGIPLFVGAGWLVMR